MKVSHGADLRRVEGSLLSCSRQDHGSARGSGQGVAGMVGMGWLLHPRFELSANTTTRTRTKKQQQQQQQQQQPQPQPQPQQEQEEQEYQKQEPLLQKQENPRITSICVH